MALTIISSSFRGGEPIPAKYTGDGENVSPPLSWSDVPAETRALALIVDDPDAPGPLPFVHWVVYKIPPTLGELAEGTNARAAGLAQGKSSFGRIGYDGPAPPPGRPHRYHFRLYALDRDLDLPAGLDKKALLAALEGHILSEAVLVAIYERRR